MQFLNVLCSLDFAEFPVTMFIEEGGSLTVRYSIC